MIRGIGNTLPPKKSPPAFKGPPPKKNLVFKDASSSFLPNLFGVSNLKHIRCFSFHIFEAAIKELGKNRKKQDFSFDFLNIYHHLIAMQELMLHTKMQQFKEKAYRVTQNISAFTEGSLYTDELAHLQVQLWKMESSS